MTFVVDELTLFKNVLLVSKLFNESFGIDSIKETVYQGTSDPFPKALFVVIINR